MAPFSTRFLTIVSWPILHAAIKGVWPSNCYFVYLILCWGWPCFYISTGIPEQKEKAFIGLLLHPKILDADEEGSTELHLAEILHVGNMFFDGLFIVGGDGLPEGVQLVYAGALVVKYRGLTHSNLNNYMLSNIIIVGRISLEGHRALPVGKKEEGLEFIGGGLGNDAFEVVEVQFAFEELGFCVVLDVD